MKDRKKIALILVGLLGLVWWWFRGRAKSTESSQDTSLGLDTILSKVFPQANPNGGLGDLKTLLDVAEEASGADPRPPIDSWHWFGGLDPGKTVSIQEFNSFEKSRCTDGKNNPVPCETVGRPCTRGFDC